MIGYVNTLQRLLVLRGGQAIKTGKQLDKLLVIGESVIMITVVPPSIVIIPACAKSIKYPPTNVYAIRAQYVYDKANT